MLATKNFTDPIFSRIGSDTDLKFLARIGSDTDLDFLARIGFGSEKWRIRTPLVPACIHMRLYNVYSGELYATSYNIAANSGHCWEPLRGTVVLKN